MAKWTDIHAQTFNGTEKQYTILRYVLAAADKGQPLPLVDLWQTLPWGPTVSKQAILNSIRTLEHHGYVERRYGKDLNPKHTSGKKQYLLPTPACYKLLRKSVA